MVLIATTRPIFGSRAEVDDAHRALAQFLFDLVAAEHRLFDAAAIERHGAAGMPAAAAEHHGLGQLLARDSRVSRSRNFGLKSCM